MVGAITSTAMALLAATRKLPRFTDTLVDSVTADLIRLGRPITQRDLTPFGSIKIICGDLFWARLRTPRLGKASTIPQPHGSRTNPTVTRSISVTIIIKNRFIILL